MIDLTYGMVPYIYALMLIVLWESDHRESDQDGVFCRYEATIVESFDCVLYRIHLTEQDFLSLASKVQLNCLD